MVVALHLVVEHLALLRGGVGDQLGFNDLEDVVADVCQLRLDLGLVVTDQGQLVALRGGEKSMQTYRGTIRAKGNCSLSSNADGEVGGGERCQDSSGGVQHCLLWRVHVSTAQQRVCLCSCVAEQNYTFRVTRGIQICDS